MNAPTRNPADKTLARIAALLRQAENTDHPHEAETFTEHAQRLASLASIDLAVARAYDPAKREKAVPAMRKVMIGEKGARGLRTYAQLFLGIGRANDLRMDIAHDSTYVIAYGYAEDIDISEQLYASLLVQMVTACSEYLDSGEYRTETSLRRETFTDKWGYQDFRYVDKPISKITARLNFQKAFAERIGSRLRTIRDQEREAALAREKEQQVADTPESSSTELALIGKEVEVNDLYKKKSTARGSWRGHSSRSAVSHGARAAGRRAGENASLGGGDTSLGGAKAALR